MSEINAPSELTASARIWSYGCLPPPLEQRQQIRALLYQANRYQNVLVRIERLRRQRYRGIRAAVAPDLETMEQRYRDLRSQIDTAREALLKARQSVRKRAAFPALDLEVKMLRQEAKDLLAIIKVERAKIEATFNPARVEYDTRRKQLAAGGGPRVLEKSNAAVLEQMLGEDWPEAWKQIARLDAWALRRGKWARRASGLPWGTYLLIDEAMAAARRDAVRDPSMKHFRGEGRVGVQIHQGMTLADLFSGDHAHLGIQPLPADIWETRSGRRKARTVVKIQLGSHKEPQWHQFRMIMHRPLPSDAVIKYAWISVRRCGIDYRYELQLTLRSRQFKTATGQGVAALNFGWRTKDNGDLRVAYLVDEFGGKKEFALPSKLRRYMDLPHSLRSFNDQHFDMARDALKAYMRSAPQPAWLTEATKNLHAWRSHSKLASIANRMVMERFPDRKDLTGEWAAWKQERFAKKHDLLAPPEEVMRWATKRGWNADTSFVIYLEWWRRKNKHLLRWEGNARSRALAWRKDLHRQWARWIASTYSTVLIEDFDLRRFAKKALPEENEEQFTAYRCARSQAAPSEFRLAIASACGTRNLRIQDAKNNTLKCAHCGTLAEQRPMVILQTCEGCHAEYDQDENNCMNQLERYQPSPADDDEVTDRSAAE